MRLLKLFKTEIADRFVRENFSRVERYASSDVFSKGNFTFFELALASDKATGYPATKEVTHALGFVPKDVLQLAVTPDTTTGYQTVVTWNFEDFTSTTLSITISAACTVRAFIGRYGES